MEPDDLSLLKVSLNPVKERAFPARAALKKKSRQRRGKRQTNDKNNEQFDEDSNLTPADSRATRGRGYSRNTRGRHDTRGEVASMNQDNTVLQSWRDRAPEQNWRLDDSMNSRSSYPTSSSESEFSDSETGQTRRLR